MGINRNERSQSPKYAYAVGFGGESGLRKAGLGGIHPLTRR
nr:DUF3265 domain-containing protein [Vibrio cidicii]